MKFFSSTFEFNTLWNVVLTQHDSICYYFDEHMTNLYLRLGLYFHFSVYLLLVLSYVDLFHASPKIDIQKSINDRCCMINLTLGFIYLYSLIYIIFL